MQVNSIIKYILISFCFWFLSVICPTFSINSLNIIFKWSLPLASINFLTSSGFFNVSPVIFLLSSSSVTILWFQIYSVYKSSHSCRCDWKEIQSWCWIGIWNTCKLFFYWDARAVTWVKNSLEKLDNKFHIKVKNLIFPNQS